MLLLDANKGILGRAKLRIAPEVTPSAFLETLELFNLSPYLQIAILGHFCLMPKEIVEEIVVNIIYHFSYERGHQLLLAGFAYFGLQYSLYNPTRMIVASYLYLNILLVLALDCLLMTLKYRSFP